MKQSVAAAIAICVELGLWLQAFAQSRDVTRTAAKLTMTGRSMSAEQSAALETLLATRPDDVEARTKLLGYYFLRCKQDESARKTRVRHVLWLIQNAPRADVLEMPEGHFLCGEPEQDAYEEGKRLWLKQTRADGHDATTLGNAASFFVSAMPVWPRTCSVGPGRLNLQTQNGPSSWVSVSNGIASQ